MAVTFSGNVSRKKMLSFFLFCDKISNQPTKTFLLVLTKNLLPPCLNGVELGKTSLTELPIVLVL